MSVKYHISPETGRPNQCRASVRVCPVGGDHFDTKEDAREAYEKQMDQATDGLRGIQKEIGDRRAAKSDEPVTDLEGNDISSVAGIELVNRESGELESVEKGYVDSEWEPRRIYRNATLSSAGGADPYENDDWCGVCSRATDHTGEHDELVEAGLASYEAGGVRKTAAWNEDMARKVSDSSYAAYELRFRVVDPANDTPEVAALKADYDRMKNSSVWSNYGQPEDEMYRHNMGEAMGKKRDEIQALQPEWDPKVEDNLRSAEKKLAASVANARFQSNPDTAIQPLPAYKLPEAGSKRTLQDAVVVKMQYQRLAPEGEPATAWNTWGTRAIIVPDLSTLTARRKAAIADEVALLSGRNLEEWNKLSQADKARSIEHTVTRHKELELEVYADGKVSFGSRYSSSNNYDANDVKLTSV